jgi:Protein of unknown function (DUF2510)
MSLPEVNRPPLSSRLAYRYLAKRLDPEYWPWVRSDLLRKRWRLRLAAWSIAPVLAVYLLVGVVLAAINPHMALYTGVFPLSGVAVGTVVVIGTPLARYSRDRRLSMQSLGPDGSPLAPQPGWFPDPACHFPWRYWDGRRWSDLVWNGGATVRDPLTDLG